MGGNRRKCRKFSRLNRFLNLQESIDQYLINVYYIRYIYGIIRYIYGILYTVLYTVYISKFSNFDQFFRFFN